jgi:hypothetical protein
MADEMILERVSSLRCCILPLDNKNRLVGLFLHLKDCTVNMMEITTLLNQNETATGVSF